jgi:hypothetical protein
MEHIWNCGLLQASHFISGRNGAVYSETFLAAVLRFLLRIVPKRCVTTGKLSQWRAVPVASGGLQFLMRITAELINSCT